MSNWVNVKDRQPKEIGMYLVADSEGYVTTNFYFGVGLWMYDDEFTHWMPFPNPPRSEVNNIETHKETKSVCG